MKTPSTCAFLALFAGLVPTLPASGQATSHQWQLGERRGPLSAAPLGMLSRAGGATDLLVRDAGTFVEAPERWSTERFGLPTPVHPDYSTAAVFAGLNRLTPVGLEATALELAAISTGGDIIPRLIVGPGAPGRIDLADGESWFFLSISVAPKPTPHGLPGSTLRSLVTTESDVVNYFSEGSGNLDESLIDSTLVEQAARDLGFDSGNQDLVGLDWNMGLISTDPTGIQAMDLAPVRDKLYFTVSRDWAMQNPGHYVQASEGAFALKPDTIYALTWQPTSSGYQWSAPSLEFSPQELFGAAGTGRAIDGISVHAEPGASRRVVLSTDLASADLDQLLVFEDAITSAAVPLRTPYGALFSEELGLNGMTSTDPDEVNGTCGRDPHEPGFSRAVAQPLGATIGEPGGEPGGDVEAAAAEPVPEAPGAQGSTAALGLSAVVAAHTRTLHLQATGAGLDKDLRVRFSLGLPAGGIFIDELVTPPVWHALGTVEVDAELLRAGLDLSLKGVPPLGTACLRAELLGAKGAVIATSRTSAIEL